MCFWRPVGVRAGEVGAPLEFTSGSSWAGKGRRGTAAGVQRDPWLDATPTLPFTFSTESGSSGM